MSKRHLWNHKHPSPMHAMKPPYNGGRAQRMGWPCEPPYQMKWAKKCRWRAQWYAAQPSYRMMRDPRPGVSIIEMHGA